MNLRVTVNTESSEVRKVVTSAAAFRDDVVSMEFYITKWSASGSTFLAGITIPFVDSCFTLVPVGRVAIVRCELSSRDDRKYHS